MTNWNVIQNPELPLTHDLPTTHEMQEDISIQSSTPSTNKCTLDFRMKILVQRIKQTKCSYFYQQVGYEAIQPVYQ